MAHGVAQIHAALVTALTGLVTTGTNVFDDETTAIPEARQPALRVLDDGEETLEYLTQRPPRTVARTVNFSIKALAKAANAKGTINTVLGEIEAAVYANRTLSGLARDMRVERVDKNYSDDADQRTGEALITIAVDWVCVEGSPQTPT